MISTLMRGIRMAFADLKYEWVMSLCMIFALAAIFAPLVILLGLQDGIIKTLLSRMESDPKNLEIETLSGSQFKFRDDWMDAMKSRKTVEWGVHKAHSISRVVDLFPEKNIKNRVEVSMRPSGPEDPLMVRNGLSGPKDQEVVISRFLADKLGVNEGATVVLEVNRRDLLPGSRSKVSENVSENVELKIVHVAPLEVDDGRAIWVDAWIANAVSDYREGRTVERLGWMGRPREVNPEFSALEVTGLGEISIRDKEHLMARTRLDQWGIPASSTDRLPGGRVQLSALNNHVRFTNLEKLANFLVEKGLSETSQIIPLVDELKVSLEGEKESFEELSVTSFPYSSKLSDDQGAPLENVRIAVNPDLFSRLNDVVINFGFQTASERLSIPCEIYPVERVGLDEARVSPKLAGLLNAVKVLEVSLGGGVLLHAQSEEREYSAFRIYARSLNDLEGLVRSFDEKGIEVKANLEGVLRIQRLSSYMKQIYVLIALTLGIGAFLAISANLYANIQRKKKDLAYLQLLGSTKTGILVFPITKSIVLVCFGLVGAFAAYLLFGSMVDHAMSENLRQGESFVSLDQHRVVMLCGAILSVSIAASLMSSLAVYRIQPSDAIRND